MQYAEVVVDHKAGYNPLTYAIPAEILADLAIGSVVLVPIGHTKVHGVVQQFTRRVDTNIALKLKPIHSVVYAGSFIPEYLIRASEMLHKRFGFGWSSTLFYFLPPLPKRRQPDVTALLELQRSHKVFDYTIPISQRLVVYTKIANRLNNQNQSLLIICASQAASQALAVGLKQSFSNVKLAKTDSPKLAREHFVHQLTESDVSIIVGTRSGLMTPLNQIGGIIIDEPWLPGQKEERSPKFWTCFAAQMLCRARNIPLYLVSSIAWPETQLLAPVTSHTISVSSGKTRLIPKRPLAEVLSQFFAQNSEICSELAIVVKESPDEIWWCPHCRTRLKPNIESCPTCKTSARVIPPLTKSQIEQTILSLSVTNRYKIFSADELMQYRQFAAILALNYDVFLSIADFRSIFYTSTLLELLKQQSHQLYLETAQPDVWTDIMNNDNATRYTTELQVRRRLFLPPFSDAVQLRAFEPHLITKLLPLAAEIVIKQGKIHKNNDKYSLNVLLKRQSRLPEAWFRSSVTVDYLPNYID
jgi:primosomal protein N'